MNKSIIKNLFEFLCPPLVLSYFFIHNIFFVIIGILLSIYIINIENIEKFVKNINIIYNHKASSKKLKNKCVLTDSKSIKTDNKIQELDLRLVEIIEESGFIPSIDKNQDINTA